MEVLRTDAAQSGTYIKPAAICSYETGKIGAWKTWHIIPHDSTKGGLNKVGGYYGAYEPQSEFKKRSER